MNGGEFAADFSPHPLISYHMEKQDYSTLQSIQWDYYHHLSLQVKRVVAGQEQAALLFFNKGTRYNLDMYQIS